MKTIENSTSAENIVSGLQFDSNMCDDVRSALLSSGISNNILTEVPDIALWRENISLLTGAMALLSVGHRPEILVEDLYTTEDASGHRLRLRTFRPKNSNAKLPLFYWMHGGGMMSGTVDQDDLQMKDIASELGIMVVSVEYRLAPEYPFPIPLTDCYHGLVYLCDHSEELGIDSSKIAVGGASAGGGLAASLSLWARAHRGPKIIHQSLVYPMLDDRNRNNSNNRLPMLGVWDEPLNVFAWQAYLGTSHKRKEAPEFAVPARVKELKGLPPAFIAVGSLDLFRDEDVSYALRLMESGVSTELHFYHGTVHGFDWHLSESAYTKDMLSKRILALRNAFNNVTISK